MCSLREKWRQCVVRMTTIYSICVIGWKKLLVKYEKMVLCLYTYLSSSFFSSSNLFYSFFFIFLPFCCFKLFSFSQPQDHLSDLSFLIWTIFKFEDLTQFFIHSSLSEMLNDVKSFYLFLEWQPCHSSVLVLSLPGKFT